MNSVKWLFMFMTPLLFHGIGRRAAILSFLLQNPKMDFFPKAWLPRREGKAALRPAAPTLPATATH